MKVEEFINLKQHNMNVDEYSLKLTIFPRYAPSPVSNPRVYMSRFVICVPDLEKEECHNSTHNDMKLSRIMVYSQYIEMSKLSKIYRN